MQDSKYELCHFGIKGMKWGIRRFQRKDGTHTPAGLKRYGDKIKEGVSKIKEKRADEKLRKKPVSKLSENELQERINRMQKEKQLLDLERSVDSMNEKHMSAGKQFVLSAGRNVLKPALIDSGRDIMTRLLKDQLGKKFGLSGREADDALKGLRDSVNELNLKKQKKELEEYFENSGSRTKAKQDSERFETLKRNVTELNLEKQMNELTKYFEEERKKREQA